MPVQAQTGDICIAPTRLQPGARRIWVVSNRPRPLYRRKRHGNHFTDGWVGFVAGLDGTKNLSPTGIRSRDSPGRNKVLYQLRYSGRQQTN
jgi:hypothetical protein